MSLANERDPLLQSEAQFPAAPPSTVGKDPSRPGPLEIPRRTRNGILAGECIRRIMPYAGDNHLGRVLQAFGSPRFSL